MSARVHRRLAEGAQAAHLAQKFINTFGMEDVAAGQFANDCHLRFEIVQAN